MNINWKQASTKRGAVVLFLSIIGVFLIMTGKDIQPLLVLTAAISGYMKLTTPD